MGGGGVGGPIGPKSILYIVMLHIKSKVMKSRIQWCRNFAPRACLVVTRGQKVRFGVLFFSRHTTPPRLFELEP